MMVKDQLMYGIAADLAIARGRHTWHAVTISIHSDLFGFVGFFVSGLSKFKLMNTNCEQTDM